MIGAVLGRKFALVHEGVCDVLSGWGDIKRKGSSAHSCFVLSEHATFCQHKSFRRGLKSPNVAGNRKP